MCGLRLCTLFMFGLYFFFFKQKTAYEMRISDWSSDVCSSDLLIFIGSPVRGLRPVEAFRFVTEKVPNPTRRTSSPRFNAPEIVSKTDSTALPASVRLRPVASTPETIISCLFMHVGNHKLHVDCHSLRSATGFKHEPLPTFTKKSDKK